LSRKKDDERECDWEKDSEAENPWGDYESSSEKEYK